MDIPLALVADAANVSREGKLNVLGVWQRIAAASFPTAHPACALVVVFRATPAERGQQKHVQIRFMGADAPIADLESRFLVPDEGETLNPEIIQVLAVQGLPLPAPGRYSFSILVNGDEKRRIEFEAVTLPEQPS